MKRAYLLTVLCAWLVASWAPAVFAQEQGGAWIKTRTLDAAEAHQAAAADDRFVYAIANRVVAQYDRDSGQRLSQSSGDAYHLNSGFFLDGKLYCAHSNFPQKPEVSVIKVLDLPTMELTDYHVFGQSPHGSLTVAVYDQGAWWCVFAVYGKGDNAHTALVKFDEAWNEQGVWKFPPSVVSDLGSASISGGIWQDGHFLATGHDKKVIYRLKVPDTGSVLVHIATHDSPFPGQGIAADPKTGGLVGIDRAKRQVVFAQWERKRDSDSSSD